MDLSPLHAWIEQHQQLAIWLVPLFAFLETCVGIGIFVSSLFLVSICTVLYVNGWLSLPAMAILALSGSSLGDHVGFYFGRWAGDSLHASRPVQRHAEKWARAEAFVRRYGVYAILIGRFLPAIRSIIPAMVGVSGFNRVRYSMIDLSACSLWALGLVAIIKASQRVFSG